MNAIIYFGHGSRDESWAQSFYSLVTRTQLQTESLVLCAFLENMTPSLSQALMQCAQAKVKRVRFVPVFVGFGNHLRHDLPRLIAEQQQLHPDISLELMPFTGEWSDVQAAIVDGALKAFDIATSGKDS